MKTKLLFAVASMVLGVSAFAADDSASKTFPTPQSASGDYAGHVGILGGYVDQNGPWKPAFGYGVDAGFQPYIPFGVGIEALFYKSKQDTAFPGISVADKRTELLARLTYNFGGDNVFLKRSYLGAKFGAVINQYQISPDNGDSTDVGSSFTRFGFGPVIGFDYPIVDHVSLGAQASYLFVTGPEKNMDTLQALASLKYWF